jgi:hypothetical protein
MGGNHREDLGFLDVALEDATAAAPAYCDGVGLYAFGEVLRGPLASSDPRWGLRCGIDGRSADRTLTARASPRRGGGRGVGRADARLGDRRRVRLRIRFRFIPTERPPELADQRFGLGELAVATA